MKQIDCQVLVGFFTLVLGFGTAGYLLAILAPAALMYDKLQQWSELFRADLS